MNQKVEDIREEAPFFSIVLPTYNRAHLLSHAIKSVLDQYYSSWELIIVDDGSTDNTRDVVGSFTDPRVKYVYQDNAERSAARNNGIRKAVGKYVCFLDSDDAFHPTHLQEVYNGIFKNKFKEAIYVVKSLAIDSESKKETRLNLVIGKNDLETVFLNSITPGQFIIPSELVKEEGFNEKVRISEDTEILVRLVQKLNLEILDVHTLLYILHEDNSVNTNRYNAFYDRMQTLKSLFQSIPKEKLSPKIKRELLSNCYFGIFRYYKAQGDILRKKWTMIKAIAKYPEHRLKEKIYLLLKG